MNIATQTEIILRDAGYDTWTSETSLAPVVCFENAALIGFLHVFESANALIADWESRQRSALARYAAALRSVGAKAWNVYSLFLTEDSDGSVYRQIERIEENFSLTRKIARGGIRTPHDLEHVLLPLTAIRSHALLGEDDFEARLRERLKEIPVGAVDAFLLDKSIDNVVRVIGEAQ